MLRDITVSIAPGERVLVAGPSGAGKSTLLRALAGLLETVDAGELAGSVTVDGHPPGSRAGEVGLVLQEPGAGVVSASVARDTAFGMENVGMPRAAMPPRIGAAMASVGLADLPPDTPTSALSGGQTQRLALAGALTLAPSLLLLDEPTAMLDPAHAAQVRRAIADVVALTGVTMVVVEHLLAPWVPHVDRLIVLSGHGEVIADGPVERVLTEHHSLLLDLGIWVPDAPTPDPVSCSPDLFHNPRGPRADGLVAGPLVIERRTRLLDASTRQRVAATTTQDVATSPGELLVLTGPSGGGKSTVLQTLAGFLRPTSGTVLLAERDPAGLSALDLAKDLAWVPQWASSTIIAHTVLDEVCYTSRQLGGHDEETTERGRRLLAALGLEALENADPRELSGGEQRRLAIASAVLHRPAVLLADEPTVGQDRHTWAAVVGLVAAYRDTGGAVIAATHDAAIIDRAAQEIVLQPPMTPVDDPGCPRPLAAWAGPLALVLAALLAIPAGILSPHWTTGLAALGAEILLACLALWAPGSSQARSGRLRAVALRLLPGLLAALSAGWSTWFLGTQSLDTAATIALRVLIIVVPSVILIPLIDPDELADHLAQRLGLPDRPVVATAAALSRVQALGDLWAELGRARRVRGVDRSWRHPVALVRDLAARSLGLLVWTLRAAAQLALAMDARGFATATRRTWLRAAPWTRVDVVVVALSLVPLLTVLLVR